MGFRFYFFTNFFTIFSQNRFATTGLSRFKVAFYILSFYVLFYHIFVFIAITSFARKQKLRTRLNSASEFFVIFCLYILRLYFACGVYRGEKSVGFFRNVVEKRNRVPYVCCPIKVGVRSVLLVRS